MPHTGKKNATASSSINANATASSSVDATKKKQSASSAAVQSKPTAGDGIPRTFQVGRVTRFGMEEWDKEERNDVARVLQEWREMDPTLTPLLEDKGSCNACFAKQKSCDGVFPCLHCIGLDGVVSPCIFSIPRNPYNGKPMIRQSAETHPWLYKGPTLLHEKVVLRETKTETADMDKGSGSVVPVSVVVEKVFRKRDRTKETLANAAKSAAGIKRSLEASTSRLPDKLEGDGDVDMDVNATKFFNSDTPQTHKKSRSVTYISASLSIASFAPTDWHPNDRILREEAQICGEESNTTVTYTKVPERHGFRPTDPPGWVPKIGRSTKTYYYNGYGHETDPPSFEIPLNDARIGPIEKRRRTSLAEHDALWEAGMVRGRSSAAPPSKFRW